MPNQRHRSHFNEMNQMPGRPILHSGHHCAAMSPRIMEKFSVANLSFQQLIGGAAGSEGGEVRVRARTDCQIIAGAHWPFCSVSSFPQALLAVLSW